MRKTILTLAASLAAAFLVTALIPSAVAEEPPAVPVASVEPAQPESGQHEVKEPQPVPSCLPSAPISCANMPTTPTSSCSCSSQLLEVKCRTCDGDRGQVLRTTCTVSNTCQNPPCDIQENYSRTGYSCAS